MKTLKKQIWKKIMSIHFSIATIFMVESQQKQQWKPEAFVERGRERKESSICSFTLQMLATIGAELEQIQNTTNQPRSPNMIQNPNVRFHLLFCSPW